MFGYILGGILAYNFLDNFKQKYYFYPSKEHYRTKYNIIHINNHYALTHIKKEKTKNKCLIISHGNAGNITNRDYLFDQLENYDGDIYCYEYGGFGNCQGTKHINSCINEHIFWLNELKNKYEEIELWGESIGGGIVIETLCRINDGILFNKIKKVYLQSTFNSLSTIISEMNSTLGFFYKLLLFDDLNTHHNLQYIKPKNIKIIILHSKNDEIIPYSEAIKNYNRCKDLHLLTFKTPIFL